MKISTKILIVLFLLAGVTTYLICDSYFLAPERLTTRKIELESEKISDSLDDMRIICFSDLDYGSFTDESRLNNLMQYINDLSPDVILFCGDIYDTGVIADEKKDEIIINAFSSLNAQYGKFAVLGDRDCTTQAQKEAVSDILYQSDFELISNSSIQIHRNSSSYITLVGLENEINGEQNIAQAYANVSRSAYVLAFCHTPDTAVQVPADLTDRFIAGHTHGGQAFWYFGSLITVDEGSYLRGTHDISGMFTLDITNGTGTTVKDVRFLANAEVVLYILKSEEIVEETASPVSEDTEEGSTAVPENIEEEQEDTGDHSAEASDPIEEENDASQETETDESIESENSEE